MGLKSTKAKESDFKLDTQQQQTAGRHASEVQRIMSGTRGLKEGLVSATKNYDTDTVQDRAVADYQQKKGKISLLSAQKGHLLGANTIEGLTSTMLGGYMKGQDEKFGAQLSTVEALSGAQNIGAKGMNYLARTKSAEILGEAQRKQSDYQSRVGAMSKIGGAIGGQVASSGWNPKDWNWGGPG